MKTNIINEMEIFNPYASDAEIEMVLEYIEKQFKTDGASHGQYENCVRLSNFVRNNNIIIGEIEAEKLLTKSTKLEEMFNDLASTSMLSSVANLSNIETLIESYCIKHGIAITEEAELNIYDKRSGKDIDLFRLYLNEIGQYKLLSAQEEKMLATRAKYGDVESRNRLVEHNLRLVISVAKMYNGFGLSMSDLVQLGNEGLMKAAQKYDVDKGYRFTTYATWWIKQSMTRGLADQSRTIRVPVHMHDLILKIKRASANYVSEHLGETPTPEQLSKILNVPEDKIYFAIKNMEMTLSLSSPIGEDDNGDTLGDMIEDERQSVEGSLDHIYMKELINELFDVLTEKEIEILKLRFGFYDKIYTLEQIGKMYNITRERVRQIETRALNKVRAMANRKHSIKMLTR